MDIRGRKMRKPPACVQCRKRKIGCDRKKPACGHCTRNNQSCFYPDVPGKYIQSHATGKPPTQNVAMSPDLGGRNRSESFTSQRGSGSPVFGLSRKNSFTSQSNAFSPAFRVNSPNNNYSRETNKLLQNNPELASLEQIREYNTNLQYMNAQRQSKASLIDSQQKGKNVTTQVIPRNVPNMDKNPVETALDSNITLNWVQGPAILDQMSSQYTPQDVLLKEMDFLKNRLIELQEITGKVVEGVDLSSTTFTGDDDQVITDSTTTTTSSIKKRKSSETENAIAPENNIQSAEKTKRTLDIFKDLDPQFLDPKEIFSIFDTTNIPASSEKHILKPVDTPNAMFSLPFLRNKDAYLISFLQNLSDIFVKNKFEVETVNTIDKLKIDLKSRILLPSNSTCLILIKLYLENMKETHNLIPFLNVRELTNFMNEINSNENPCVLESNQLLLDKLINIGELSVLLLIIYEMLSSSVLIILNDEQMEAYRILSSFIDKLTTNALLVKNELSLRPAAASVIENLVFITLWKFYETIASFNEYIVNNNNTSGHGLIDFDEDIQYGLHLSLNHENKNDKPILLWNFICRNYLWRHVFKGEYSSLFFKQLNLNSTPIMDPLFSNDVILLSFQTELIEYLQSKDRILSLYKIVGMKELLQIRYEEHTKKCLTMATMVNGNIDSIIYRNSMLYITYFLLLQHEKSNDLKNFVFHYKELLKFIQDSIFFVFSNLASKNFAAYEFLFQKRSYDLINTICDIILGLYQRSHYAFKNVDLSSDVENNLSNNIKEHTLSHAEHWITIIRKLLILLQDYSKNCKKLCPILVKIMTKLETIITYDIVATDPSTHLASEFKNGLLGMNNVFEIFEEEDIVKFNKKLKSISESLINPDFYKAREPFQPLNLGTMGITDNNCQALFDAFRE
ncbi:chromatin structure-remodeling complex protein Rsc3p [Monosporozyma servazzii]